MAFGDGESIRALLEGILTFLHKFAAPTGTRGSVLLMAGGLVVLGFLFLAFVFRSAIIGDLAPVANARTPNPRVMLPTQSLPPAVPVPLAAPLDGEEAFTTARTTARRAGPGLDAALDQLRGAGLDVRIVQSSATTKIVRAYACPTCQRAPGLAAGCEHERGLLAGAFEAASEGALAKVHEVACARAGASHCEFVIEHGPLPLGVPA